MPLTFSAADDGAPLAEGVLESWAQVNFDKYGEALADRGWTMRSLNVPLPLEAARALLKEGPSAVSLDPLKVDIDEAMKSLKRSSGADSDGGYFVRLSTRSPKDAADKLDRSADCVAEALRQILHEKRSQAQRPLSGEFTRAELDELDDSELLVAVRQGLFSALRVTAAAEALDIFSRSSRIISDLKRYIEAYDHKQTDADAVPPEGDAGAWDLYVTVREFVRFPLEGELRGFVYENRLTAVSQYFTELLLPGLADRKQQDSVLHRVSTFFEQVQPVLREQLPDVSNYIIDFAIDLSPGGTTDWVIEVNPFGELTGAGFFDWTDDIDILEGRGESKKPVFRVREEPLEDFHLRGLLSAFNVVLNEAKDSIASSHDENMEAEEKVNDGKKCSVQ